MPVDSALIEALTAPITGGSGGGQDLRYDPRYDVIREARREAPFAEVPKEADWPAVVALSRELLATETRDLQLAAWLTEALLRRDGLGGLATGVDLMRAMLERFWDACYPEWDEENAESRAGPLEWVGSKLAIPVRQAAIAPGGISLLDYEISRGVPTEAEAEANPEKRALRADAVAHGKQPPEQVDRVIAEARKPFYRALVDDADAALAAVSGLERVSDERLQDALGSNAPSFRQLRVALDDVRRFAAGVLTQKLVDDPDPVADVEQVDADVGAYEPPAGWTAGEGMPAEPVSARDACARAAVAAAYLRRLDPTTPAPYLMLRGLRWGELRGTGASLDPKLLDAPPTAVRVRLKELLLDGRWSALLEQCETAMAMPYARGWLDLQRYALTACDRLGGSYDGVAAAVRGELRALLAALPQLPEASLMDDTPAANAETYAWLQAQGLVDGVESAAASAADAAVDDQSAALDAALTEDDATSEHGGLRAGPRRRVGLAEGGVRDPFVLARAELAQGRPNRAIELLLAELARERSPRGRFVRQTQVAYVMVEGGLHAVARPILDRLVTTIDERGLEDWEAGPLVAQPMALLCRVLDKLEEGEDQRTELYLRICRLDPLQAIALQGPAT